MNTSNEFDSQFADSMVEIRDAHNKIDTRFAEMETRITSIDERLTSHTTAEIAWQNSAMDELRRNTEITVQIRDAKTFARIGSKVVVWVTGAVVGAVGLLIAVKTFAIDVLPWWEHHK